MRSLQESSPGKAPEFTNEDIEQKFNEIMASSFSPEDRLMLGILINQNPLQAVGVVALDSINRIESNDLEDNNDATDNAGLVIWEAEVQISIKEEQVRQKELHFAKWEKDLNDTYENTSSNRRLAELGSVLDYSRDIVLDEETAEKWQFLKQQVADIRIIPYSSLKIHKTDLLESQIAQFLQTNQSHVQKK